MIFVIRREITTILRCIVSVILIDGIYHQPADMTRAAWDCRPDRKNSFVQHEFWRKLRVEIEISREHWHPNHNPNPVPPRRFNFLDIQIKVSPLINFFQTSPRTFPTSLAEIRFRFNVF